MRTAFILATAAPLALLAACGSTVPADESSVEPMTSEVAALDRADAPMPGEAPASFADTDYAGTYTREVETGTEQLTLDPASDSYEYTAPDGSVSSGSYTMMDDDRRLAIEDLDGQPAYFSFADGSIYRLTDADTPADQITLNAQYRREPAREAQETEPEAMVDNVADEAN